MDSIPDGLCHPMKAPCFSPESEACLFQPVACQQVVGFQAIWVYAGVIGKLFGRSMELTRHGSK